MKLLLDTHVLLWWLAGEPMRQEATAEIRHPRSLVHVSAASAWEIGIKQSLGKLRLPDDLEERLRVERFTPLPVTVAHGLAVAGLPPHHRDPFDRLLVAQAQAEGLTLITRDPRLTAYGVATLAA